jgi:DNA (cytosine-5)-methyltransferase 1
MAFPWQSALDPIGKPDNISGTLIKNQTMAVAFEANMSLQTPSTNGVNPTLTRRTHASVAIQSAVRRLTPRECERLQGFPDDYTAIPYRNKPAEQCPDGPRYKALGNSMAVPVMRWIGERIAEVDAINAS